MFPALALVATVPAVTIAQRAPQVRIAFTEETLPNGLHVIYSVNRTTPVIAVEMMYNVASKSEKVGKTGFAHLFEHMMFKGSRNVPDGQHGALLDKAGARTGADYNGTTSWDRTNYFEQLPSNQLELALFLESDRMGTLLETLTREKLDNQREVVKNERRQSTDNQPYGSWLEKALLGVYPDNHPYQHSVIGSMTDLSNASLDDVKTFFKTYYAPNNAVMVIAGDFDLAQTKQLVRKYFASIPRGPAVPPQRSMAAPAIIGREIREVVNDPLAPAPQVYVAYRVPSQKSKQGAAVTLMSGLLAGGTASPLYKSLVREKQAAVSVGGFNIGLVDGADMLVFIAQGKPGSDALKLESDLVAELDKAAGMIDQAGLDRVRAGQRFQFVNGLQTTGGFGGIADQLAEGYTYFRNANKVNTTLAEYDAVTVAQLRAVAAERLVPKNRVRLVYVPVKKAAVTGGSN
ncbi:MAG TPA: pitrilysin family protein [Gemmatimonadaceae bacterium]|nr:pitrilysin family protein [Gemmatimonadaceae bacterium]